MKEKGCYDNSVDIWSIGVLTYELLTGVPPYHNELLLAMKNNPGVSKPGARKINWSVKYPPTLSGEAESFIRSLLK
jgi:serine/threonine protein kinase